MHRITKLIVIDFCLLIAVNKIPYKEITKDIEMNNTIIIAQDVEQQISSRSLIETRESEIIATTYSDKCVEMVKQFEGFSEKAYHNEGEQYLTIGYGHYGADVKEGQTITIEEAERLLKADLDGICKLILQQDKGFNQNQLDALCSFGMNLGPRNIKKLLKDRSKEEIANHITSYTKSESEIYRNGLLNRREKELELYLEEI